MLRIQPPWKSWLVMVEPHSLYTSTQVGIPRSLTPGCSLLHLLLSPRVFALPNPIIFCSDILFPGWGSSMVLESRIFLVGRYSNSLSHSYNCLKGFTLPHEFSATQSRQGQQHLFPEINTVRQVGIIFFSSFSCGFWECVLVWDFGPYPAFSGLIAGYILNGHSWWTKGNLWGLQVEPSEPRQLCVRQALCPLDPLSSSGF